MKDIKKELSNVKGFNLVMVIFGVILIFTLVLYLLFPAKVESFFSKDDSQNVWNLENFVASNKKFNNKSNPNTKYSRRQIIDPAEARIRDALIDMTRLSDNYNDTRLSLTTWRVIDRNRDTLRTKGKSISKIIMNLENQKKEIENKLQTQESNLRDLLSEIRNNINYIQDSINKSSSNISEKQIKLEQAKYEYKKLKDIYDSIYDREARIVKIESIVNLPTSNDLLKSLEERKRYYQNLQNTHKGNNIKTLINYLNNMGKNDSSLFLKDIVRRINSKPTNNNL